MADAAALYNCQVNNAEPDWSRYERLELAGCRNESPFNIVGLLPAREADFFTVYGRFPEPDGTCEAITDATDAKAALSVAGALALRSGLPLIVSPSLAPHDADLVPTRTAPSAYTFDALLKASITVEADSEEEARRIVGGVLVDAAHATFCEGDPVDPTDTISGEVSLMEDILLVQVDGEDA